MKIRRRVSLLYWVPVALLVAAGFVLDRRATTLRVRSADDRLDRLEKSLSSLREAVEDAKKQAVSSAAAEILHARRIGDASNIFDEVPRPRFLGSGRSASFFYADVRFPSGATFRYYVPTNATRARVSRWIRGIAEDARLDAQGFIEERSPVGDW